MMKATRTVATSSSSTTTTTTNALRTLLEADEAWSAQQQQQQQQQRQESPSHSKKHHYTYTSPSNKRQRKHHSHQKSPKQRQQLSEEDFVTWHVKSMLAVDRCLQNNSSYNANIQQAQRYKRQVAAARLQMTHHAASATAVRHVPTDLPPPTIQKDKHAKITHEANLQRIAKKLQQMKATGSPVIAAAAAAAAAPSSSSKKQQRKRKSTF